MLKLPVKLDNYGYNIFIKENIFNEIAKFHKQIGHISFANPKKVNE